MTPSTPEQPDPPLDEELVAYLDGELDREGSEAIERRVQFDEGARQQLQQFDRVWNALDQLARPEASPTFTRTTIEMVASEADRELVQATAMLPVRRRVWRLQVLAVCAASLLLGFTLLWLLLPNSNRTLYANLPAIEQVDVYGEFRDIEFLRQLDQHSGDWLRSGERGRQASLAAGNVVQLVDASYSERKEYVEKLDPKARGELANKARRYAELSRDSRRELDRREAELRRDPNARRLRETAWAYYAWLSQFSEVDQAKLRWLDNSQRIAEIERMNAQRLAREDRQLSDENAKGLREALEKMDDDPEIARLHEAFLTMLRNREQRGGWRGRGPEESIRGSVRMVLWMTNREGHEIPAEAATYRAAVEERLLAALDDQTAAELRARPDDQRGWMLITWLRQLRRERPDIATLEAYFQSGKFTQEEQYELLSMPSEQMYRALEWHYMQEQAGGDRDRDERGRGPRFPNFRGDDPRGFDRGPDRRDREGRENGTGQRERGRQRPPGGDSSGPADEGL